MGSGCMGCCMRRGVSSTMAALDVVSHAHGISVRGSSMSGVHGMRSGSMSSGSHVHSMSTSSTSTSDGCQSDGSKHISNCHGLRA